MFIRRCGEEQDDNKFYDKLKRLLVDEAFSVEIFDDQEDHDAGVYEFIFWNHETNFLATVHYGMCSFSESQWPSVAVVESGRKMPWSDRETQALLEIWGEARVQHSLKSCLKNRHIYRYISRRMLARGFNRTGEQCHSRVKRLKAQFYYDRWVRISIYQLF